MSAPGPSSQDDPGPRPSGRGAALMAWALSTALIVAAAALAAWGLHALFKPRQVLIPIERPSRVVDLGEPPPSAPSVGAPAPGASSNAPPVVVRNATWIAAPEPEFPAEALRRGVQEGTVRLTCTAGVRARLTDCVIHAETPAGAGFGEASLAAAREAVISPRVIDGKPVPSQITYTNRFRLHE